MHWPTLFSGAMFPGIGLVYTLLARREERKMVQQFGMRYEAYRQRVPMFFPKPNLWRRLLTPTDSAPGAEE